MSAQAKTSLKTFQQLIYCFIFLNIHFDIQAVWNDIPNFKFPLFLIAIHFYYVLVLMLMNFGITKLNIDNEEVNNNFCMPLIIPITV